MSGQKDSGAKKNGGSQETKDDRKAMKQAQQKAEKKARIAAIKEENKKKEEEKGRQARDEAGPSHRFQPLPHSLETSPQYTSDSEEDNLLLIAAEFLKKPETSNNNSQEPRPPGRYIGGYIEEIEDDLDAPIVIRTAHYEDPNFGKEYPERSQTEMELADFMARVGSSSVETLDNPEAEQEEEEEASAKAVEQPEPEPEPEPVAGSSQTPETPKVLSKEEEAKKKEEEAKKNKAEKKKKQNQDKRLAKKLEKEQQQASENGDGPSQENGADVTSSEPATETPVEDQQNGELSAAPAAQGEPTSQEVLATQAVAPDGGDEHKGNPKKKKNKKKKQGDDDKAKQDEKLADEKYKELFGDDYETPKSSKSAGHSKQNNAKKVEKKEKKAPVKKENSVVKEEKEEVPVEKIEKVNHVEKPAVAQKTENNVLSQAVKKLEQLELQLPADEEYSSASDNEFTLVTNKKKKTAESGSSENVSLASKNSPVVQENGSGSPRVNDSHHPHHGYNNQPVRRTYYSRTWKGRDVPQQKQQYDKKAGPIPQMSQQEFPPLPHQNTEKQSAQPACPPATISVWNKQKEQEQPKPVPQPLSDVNNQPVTEVKNAWTGNHTPVVNGDKAAEARETSKVEKLAVVTKKEEPAERQAPQKTENVVNTGKAEGEKKENFKDVPAGIPSSKVAKKHDQPKHQKAWKQYPRKDYAPYPKNEHVPYPRNEQHQYPQIVPQPPIIYNGTLIAAAPSVAAFKFAQMPVERVPIHGAFSYFEISLYKEEKSKRFGSDPSDPIFYLPGSRRALAEQKLSEQDWEDIFAAKYNPKVHEVFNDAGIQYSVGTGIAGTGLMDVEHNRRNPIHDHTMTYSNVVGKQEFNLNLKIEEKLMELESTDLNWPLKDEQAEIWQAKYVLIEQAYGDASLTEFEKELLSAILEYDEAKTMDILQRDLPDVLPEGNAFRYANVINKIMSYPEKQNGITVFHLLCASKNREQCRTIEYLFSQVPAEKVTSWLNVTDYTAHRNGVHFAAISGYSFIVDTLFPYLGNSNLNRRDSSSCTPMDYAAQRNGIEICRILHWAGADLMLGPYVTVKNDATAYVDQRLGAMTNVVGAFIRNAYKNIVLFQEPATPVHFVKFEAGHQGRVQFEIPPHFFEISGNTPNFYKATSLYLAVQPVKYTCMDFQTPGKNPHIVEMNLPKRITLLAEMKVTDKGRSQCLTHFMCQKSGYAFKIPALCSDKALVTFKMDPKLEVAHDKGENLLLAMQLYVASPQVVQEEVQQPAMLPMNQLNYVPQGYPPMPLPPNYPYNPYPQPILYGPVQVPMPQTFAQINAPPGIGLQVIVNPTHPNFAYPPPYPQYNNNLPTGKYPPVKQHPH